MQVKRVEKKISQILPGFVNEEDVTINGIQQDSRLVQEGELFLAVPGSETDGRHYIDAAVASGAAAVLYESGWKENLVKRSVPMIEVEELTARSGEIASRFFDDPSRKMDVIAVTGTNGKSSCSHFIATSLTVLGTKCGVIGTLGYGVPPDLTPFGLTTPDAIRMQQFLSEINLQQAEAVAIEASSHGLVQGRLNGTDVKIAVLTNLTRDHLDYHGDLLQYKSSKRILFEMPSVESAVLNIDDPFGLELQKSLPEKINRICYSLEDKGADVFCEDMSFHEKGMSSHVTTPWGSGWLESSLYGRFNLSNLLAVLCVLGTEGNTLEYILSTMSDIKNIRGRMDRIDHPDRATVVIDFAHTPDALEQALLALREHCTGELWCVFGCGGDRDRGKRPEMGGIAARLSDHIVLTDDNPRREDSEGIMDEIMEGVAEPDKVHVDSDRSRAIEYAIHAADVNDVVLIAGKGHEDYQEVAGVKRPFSDYEQVEIALGSQRA
ncbi:MAG: UDP-N-acetylmuramoyl-L-alanyl-D-glutamate--2,6-diaminopimelate ligase [Pseudomonadales bacterium]|jgi:UDP-N-acetylmuramoyl-L-alanyl-D-glutamate--2,6-diaminopimelate ligase|nr:UDP-N-acetylmuramoyl-L-alanyl-D-glutamate--2,6-diaminopimelate ligase [Pseudomonadales bacterium]MDP7144969.1 UDP-N-acetylmuramoyl-L-alanyl-D-glutamate--2,6-diaminopimelate ligase [Pseudomonadales bacterium]MDP7357151.1 UDP-N-acetylmuramoyl-L-alanyl-D-glutamate--2,6-diaminopimelate ligase [Pseudomonadales bacterium]MDP7594786.1 UDP-N-acetylmuramoyl-L-alanyl-D-glutamate--2,6-diaminopimelate ligase [Pseudomonadales bacterium]HJN50035.1 UDP-N-acetylmuramoyl-L-alanyl-D-glutamate--2,6-diaminopime|tara:strand:- start:6149 stop:7627 length:1479 start_codon:yes stop_codon:yes gene_type:complete